LHSDSDAGTNLKVERGGGTHPARGANFFVVPLNFFDYTSTISCFAERFRDGQHNLVKCLVRCSSTYAMVLSPMPSYL